jgi:hypothetical protein
VSENVHKVLSDAEELQEKIRDGRRVTSVVIAVIAVLAALGTLFTHHRSISALTVKNQAILAQARASDAYNKYEAKQVRSQVARVLLSSGVPQTAAARKELQTFADSERDTSVAVLTKARALEASSEEDDVRSEKVLKSYETMQIATTFFDIAIVLVSISTVVQTRAFLTAGGALSVIGIVFLIFGFFQAS